MLNVVRAGRTQGDTNTLLSDTMPYTKQEQKYSAILYLYQEFPASKRDIFSNMSISYYL
jgi:hypothetical protein